MRVRLLVFTHLQTSMRYREPYYCTFWYHMKWLEHLRRQHYRVNHAPRTCTHVSFSVAQHFWRKAVFWKPHTKHDNTEAVQINILFYRILVASNGSMCNCIYEPSHDTFDAKYFLKAHTRTGSSTTIQRLVMTLSFWKPNTWSVETGVTTLREISWGSIFGSLIVD